MTPLTSDQTADRPPRLQRLLGFLASDPDNMALRADVFEDALQAGDFRLAREQVTAARQHASTPDWLMREVNLAIAQSHLDQAEALLLSMQRAMPPHPSIAQNLGFIAALRGRHEACLNQIVTWADVPSTTAVSAGLQVLWLRTLHHLGQIDRAMDWARRRLAGNALQPEALGVASLVALDADQMGLAKAWSIQALDSTASPVLEAEIARATCILDECGAAAALAAVNDILRRHPQDGRTWSLKGFAHMLALDIDNARRSLERATASMPSHIGTWHGLAWACLLGKDYAAAQHAFDGALKCNRNFAESHGGLAVLAAIQGQREAAQEHLRRAQGLDSESLSARYAQALLNGDIQDERALLEFARRILSGRFSRRKT